jgi:hypothetical protein
MLLPWTAAPSLDVSRVSSNVEPMGRATAVDEAVTVLDSLRGVRFCTRSARDVGVETGISSGNFDLRKRGITEVDGQINLVLDLTLVLSIVGDQQRRTTAPESDSDALIYWGLTPLHRSGLLQVRKTLRNTNCEIGVRGLLLSSWRRGWYTRGAVQKK